jgi:hypothetical protein
VRSCWNLDKLEVDFVFLGLERVASAAGSAFRQGIVLYDGVQTLSFADSLRAVPLSALWA